MFRWYVGLKIRIEWQADAITGLSGLIKKKWETTIQKELKGLGKVYAPNLKVRDKIADWLTSSWARKSGL